MAGEDMSQGREDGKPMTRNAPRSFRHFGGPRWSQCRFVHKGKAPSAIVHVLQPSNQLRQSSAMSASKHRQSRVHGLLLRHGTRQDAAGKQARRSKHRGCEKMTIVWRWAPAYGAVQGSS